MSDHTPGDVLTFWMSAGEERWFERDTAFDAEIRDRFGALHGKAAAGKLTDWEESREGRLALVILLDQFSRNLYRDDPRTYAEDANALALAETAIAAGDDLAWPEAVRRWLYMPFMHAEDDEAQAACVRYFNERTGDAESQKFAAHHADIVRRFGRFPHRNALLGRESTPAEEAFLAEGGFAG